MKQLLTYLALISLLLLQMACSNSGKNRKPVFSDQEMKNLQEPLVRVNQNLTEQDEIRMRKYAERMGWDMLQTKSGLRYMILEAGQGDSIQDKSPVELKYHISVLNHGPVYSSDSLGNKNFYVNHSDIEEGLNEAVQLMTYGTKARLLVPPHLGFGLRGDDWLIPARAILIYEIEILP